MRIRTAWLLAAAALFTSSAAYADARPLHRRFVDDSWSGQRAGFGMSLGGFSPFDAGFATVYGSPLTFSGKLRWLDETGFGIEGEVGGMAGDGTPNATTSNENSYYERGDVEGATYHYRFYSKAYNPGGQYFPVWTDVTSSIQMWPILFSVRQNFAFTRIVSPYVGAGVGLLPYVETFSGRYLDSGTNWANDGFDSLEHRDLGFEGHAFAGVEFFPNHVAHLYLEGRASYASVRSITAVYPSGVTEPGGSMPAPKSVNLGGLTLRMGLDFLF